MQTKTTVKVISLYDLIANNTLLIFAILHHIFILSFNNHSIEYIDHVKLDFPEYQKIFDEIHLNLEICQIITLFTIFLIYLASNFTYLFKQFTLEQIRIGIMGTSFITKMIVTLYQLYHHYDKNFYKIINAEKDLALTVIDLSYMFRIVSLIVGIIILLLFSIGFCLDKLLPRINHFAKNFKFTYIEHTLGDEKNGV